MADVSAAIAAAQQELLNSVQNLEPLAEHIQSTYTMSCASDARVEVFADAKKFVAQSLASVAYQVNEVATLMGQLFGQQEEQISELSDRMRLPRQQIEMHNEHIGRRSIASLTVPRKSTRAKKAAKVAVDEPVVEYPRMTIAFDALDKIGHGTTIESDENRFPTAARPYTQRSERRPSILRATPRSEAESMVEDIYGSIGAVKSRPPPPAAPGVPRTVPSIPRMSTGSFSRPVANPVPTAHPSPMAMPAARPPLPPQPPQQPPLTPAVINAPENIYEDINTAPVKAAPPPAVKSAIAGPPLGAPPAAPPPFAFPPPPPPTTLLLRAVALYDYAATQGDELAFQEGEVIDIVARNDDGWFEGTIGLRHGLFPGNYCQELAESES